MTNPETLEDGEEMEESREDPECYVRIAGAQRSKLEILHFDFNEHFNNARIVLAILVAITIALGIFVSLHRVPSDMGVPLMIIVLFMGYGFYTVVSMIIKARTLMRKARKLQEMLRTTISDQREDWACDQTTVPGLR